MNFLFFNAVIREQPNHGDAHLQLAELYHYDLHDNALARRHYNALLKANPRHQKAQQVRERLSVLTP